MEKYYQGPLSSQRPGRSLLATPYYASNIKPQRRHPVQKKPLLPQPYSTLQPKPLLGNEPLQRHQTQRHSLKITAEVVDSSKHKHSRSSVFQRLGKPVNNNADDDNPKPATVIRNHDEAYRLHLEKLKRSKLPNQPTNQLHSNEQPKAETNVGRAPVMKDTCSNVVDEDITRLSRYLIHMRSLKSAKNISTVTRNNASIVAKLPDQESEAVPVESAAVDHNAPPTVEDDNTPETIEAETPVSAATETKPVDSETSVTLVAEEEPLPPPPPPPPSSVALVAEEEPLPPPPPSFVLAAADASKPVPEPCHPTAPRAKTEYQERRNIFEKMEGDMLTGNGDGVACMVLQCAADVTKNGAAKPVPANGKLRRRVEQDESKGPKRLLITARFDTNLSKPTPAGAAKDEIPVENRSKKEDNTWYCDTCEKHVSEEKIIHFRDKNHKNNKKWNRPHCQVCDVYFNRPRQFVQHSKTEAHKEKLKEKRLTDEGSSLPREETPKAEELSADPAAEAKKTESAGSTVSAAKTDFVNDSKTENASSRDRSARDFPHIIPVSGFYCEACCDFFFDEPSTLEHCASNEHTQKVAENCKSARRQVNNDAARKEEVPAGSADDVTSAAHKTKQTAKGKRRKKNQNGPALDAKQLKTEPPSKPTPSPAFITVDLTEDDSGPEITEEAASEPSPVRKSRRLTRQCGQSPSDSVTSGLGTGKWKLVIPKKKQFK